MEIEVGDKFKTPESTYTVISVNGEKIKWDCAGRKRWIKTVNIKNIEEWIQDKRLVKVYDK